MQFGTTNAVTDFQWYISNTIRDALDDSVSAYLDNILIFSNLEKEHQKHVKWVMQCVLEAGIYLKSEKYEFHNETVRYLGSIIARKGISMDQDEVETVRYWSCKKKPKNGRLSNLFVVQQFLGFCDYYQRCISKNSEKPEPLTILTRKDEPFV